MVARWRRPLRHRRRGVVTYPHHSVDGPALGRRGGGPRRPQAVDRLARPRAWRDRRAARAGSAAHRLAARPAGGGLARDPGRTGRACHGPTGGRLARGLPARQPPGGRRDGRPRQQGGTVRRAGSRGVGRAARGRRGGARRCRRASRRGPAPTGSPRAETGGRYPRPAIRSTWCSRSRATRPPSAGPSGRSSSGRRRPCPSGCSRSPRTFGREPGWDFASTRPAPLRIIPTSSTTPSPPPPDRASSSASSPSRPSLRRRPPPHGPSARARPPGSSS